MRIHPVFHNLLLKPYIETSAHRPNFARPPPEFIRGEEGHYGIEKILQECPTRNKKSTQYLVKWKGYLDSENSWLPAKELTYAKDLLYKFKSEHTSKEGILSRLSTHYLCRSSEGLDNRLELKVIDEEEEMGDGKTGEAEDDGSEVA
jgi:hypothetical protein